MENKEILKKAIEKAYKNKWNGKLDWMDEDDWRAVGWCGRCEIAEIDTHDDGSHTEVSSFDIIFSNSFAKAFFGKEALYQGKTINETYEEYKDNYADREDFEMDWICEFYPEEAWAYRLKQMVLHKNPLEYLEKFL